MVEVVEVVTGTALVEAATAFKEDNAATAILFLMSNKGLVVSGNGKGIADKLSDNGK